MASGGRVGEVQPGDASMLAAFLPGDSTVAMLDRPVPTPAHGQVLVRMHASGICGSDLRCAYVEHVGTGPEAYQNVIAGHEPAGEVIAVGPGCRQLVPGARVAIYHISGCGRCGECRTGYMIGCTGDARAAYGWQRDGGHATFLVAEERDCVVLPDGVSFTAGALAACGLGTAYEALTRTALAGTDTLLIVGMGPVGMAAGVAARAFGAHRVLGVDLSPERLAFAQDAGCIDDAIEAGDDTTHRILRSTGGTGAQVSIDCSGSAAGRAAALEGTATWGRSVLVGEGGRLDVDASAVLIHRQISLFGSWVTSIGRMQDLVESLPRWPLAPDVIVSHRFPLPEAEQAYATAAGRATGKVVVEPDA